jgi:hypothetical protein
MGLVAQHNMIVFAKQVGTDMVAALNNTPIFFPFMLAQACAESGYGTSSAAKRKNNYFGVMNGNTTASFASPKEAFVRQIMMLSNANLPYVSHGVLSANSPYLQARAVADSGYYSMTNDQTLGGDKVVKGTIWSGYTWNGVKWEGSNFTNKQSADHYYKILKSFINDALIVFPFGKVDATTVMAINDAIINTQIPTV